MELSITQIKELLKGPNKTFSNIIVKDGDLLNYNLEGFVFDICIFAIDLQTPT